MWTGGHRFDDTFFTKRTFDHFIGKLPFSINSWFTQLVATFMTNQQGQIGLCGRSQFFKEDRFNNLVQKQQVQLT